MDIATNIVTGLVSACAIIVIIIALIKAFEKINKFLDVNEIAGKVFAWIVIVVIALAVAAFFSFGFYVFGAFVRGLFT